MGSEPHLCLKLAKKLEDWQQGWLDNKMYNTYTISPEMASDLHSLPTNLSDKNVTSCPMALNLAAIPDEILLKNNCTDWNQG